MNRTDFCKQFAAEHGANRIQAKETCIAVFDLLARCIKENDRVYIKGLGTFRKKAVKERRVYSFKDGDVVTVPASERIVFEFYGKSDDDAEE